MSLPSRVVSPTSDDSNSPSSSAQAIDPLSTPPENSIDTTGDLSLACQRCRSRHQRCDGAQPACAQCVLTAHECVYPKNGTRNAGPVPISEQLDRGSSACQPCKLSNLRCNRATPCNFCIGRNAAQECLYPWTREKQADYRPIHPFSLFEDLTHMNSDTVPATEAAVDTIKRFAMFACTAQQNCQTLFSLISIARDTSEAIHHLIHQFDTHDLEEEKRWMAFDRYNAMLDALESVLRDCSGVIARDHGQFDSVLQSWSQDRAVLRRSLDTLQAAPFGEDQGSLDRAEHLRATFRHDDMSWLETLCDHVKIRMNATGSNNGSPNARSALTMLLELQSQLNWSVYQPEALEVTNELAASIYLVLGSQQDTHNQSAWEIIDRSGSTILHAITSGDFRDLPAVDIKLAAPGKVLHPVMSSEEPVTAGDTKTMFLKPLDPTPSQSLHPDLSPLNSIKVDSLYRDAPEAQGMVNGDTIKLDSQPFEFGEYADVYRGKWVGPSVKEIVVAVKIFHRRASAKNGKHVDQRFEQEIYILHRVRHTRIVPLYGFMASQGIDRDSRLRLVSPYYKNGNLRTYLGNNPGATKLELLYQAAQGLDYLHSYKPFAIAHLDVKAENVLITDEGEASISDFGIARILDYLGIDQAILGSFFAPEVICGAKGGTSADVYSLACLILEIMSDRVDRGKSGTWNLGLFFGKMPLPKDHPISGMSESAIAVLWQLLNRCWSREPEDRPLMYDVITELQEVCRLA